MSSVRMLGVVGRIAPDDQRLGTQFRAIRMGMPEWTPNFHRSCRRPTPRSPVPPMSSGLPLVAVHEPLHRHEEGVEVEVEDGARGGHVNGNGMPI